MLKLLYLLLYCEGREERKYKEQQFVSPKLWDTLKPSLATAAALLTTSSHGRLQQIYGVTKKKKQQHLIKMNFSIFLPSVQCVGTVQSPEHAWHSYLQTCLKINYRCKWKNADVSGFLHPSLYTTLACETLCSTSLLNALGADPRKLITLVSFLCMSWTSMIPPLQWEIKKGQGLSCVFINRSRISIEQWANHIPTNTWYVWMNDSQTQGTGDGSIHTGSTITKDSVTECGAALVIRKQLLVLEDL